MCGWGRCIRRLLTAPGSERGAPSPDSRDAGVAPVPGNNTTHSRGVAKSLGVWSQHGRDALRLGPPNAPARAAVYQRGRAKPAPGDVRP